MKQLRFCLIIFLSLFLITACSDHTHTYDTNWSYDETTHFHKSTCGHDVVSDQENHNFDEGRITKEATETETGIKIYTCETCGYEKEETIEKLPHTHKFETVWSYDETTHFHKSTCGHDVVSDQENHNFDEGRITKEATETETGIKIYTCETCGYEKEETIEKLPHTHKFETVWSYDETTHFHKSTCGHDVVSDQANHTYDKGVVETPATEDAEGVMVYTCTVCKAEKRETIEKLPHTHKFETVWSYDETTHFHKSTCGHDVVDAKADHNFDEGRITKEATETETGIKIYTCETCGYEKEETIEKLPHTHKFETVWSYDETTHFHKSTCGHDVVSDQENHNFDEGRITKEATETTNGTKIYTCETCGYEKEEVIPMIGPKTIYVNAYNTQDVTDGFGTYEGLELFKSGVTIGASLYWYKVAVVKSGNVYVVSEIAIEGKSLTKAYDYLFLSYKSESTGTYQKFLDLNLQLGDIVTFAVDPSTLEAGSVNLKVTFSKVEIKYHTLTLVAEGADSFTYEKDVIEGAVITLPKLTKPGYTFVGWYDNTNFIGSIYETITITSDITLYAKFEEKTYTDPLDYVSDVVTSNTIDELPSYMGLKTLTWKSSNPNLYTIDGNRGYTNRMYQTHQKQQVNITVYVLEDGVTTEYSKTITINPVLFDDMKNPKSVYFAVGSASSYMKYNERYKTNKTLFSDKFKNHMDMVYYAFAVPQSDGSLTLNTLYLEEVMKLKNNGIRVLLVIDGANKAPLQAMVQLCNNDETRQTFVNSIVSLVQRYNFDGIDVDWEFPGISGLTGYTTEIDRTNLNKLLRDLRNKLNSIQDPDGSNYILSIAAPSTYWGVDRYDYDGRYSGSVGGINDYCDYVNMMSYDLNKSESTSHLSHLHIPSNSYSYKFAVDYGVSYFTSLGLDKNKIIIGSAAYGKAYNITGTVNQTAEYPALGVTGTLGQVSGYGLPGQSITWNSGTIYYTGIQTLIASGAFKQYDEYNNSNKFVGSYLYSSKDNVFITFDSKKAIEEKCKYAKANGLGIMVWAYGEDATDTIVDTICDNL